MPSHHARFPRSSGEYLIFTQEGIAVLLIIRRSKASPRPLDFGMDYLPGLESSSVGKGLTAKLTRSSGRAASPAL